MKTTLMMFLCSAVMIGLTVDPGNGQPLASSGSLPAPFDQASEPSDEALEIYAALTGRTVLRPGSLRQLPASIKPKLPTDTNAAIALIVSELAKCRLEVVPDGKTFARVLPEGWTKSLMGQQLARIQPPPPSLHSGSNIHGANFRSNFAAGLDIYSALRERTVLYPSALPRPPFLFRTQTPLTREEMVYALTVILALNGVAAVDDGDQFVQLVPLEAAPYVALGAPKRLPGEPLLDPSKLPSFPDPLSFSPLISRPRRQADRLIALYAELTGRKALAADLYGDAPVPFNIRTPLTDKEILYAIETTLAFNNLTIIPVDDQSIRVGHITERSKPTQNPSDASRKP